MNNLWADREIYENEVKNKPHSYSNDATYLAWFNSLSTKELIIKEVLDHWSWIGDNYYADYNDAFYSKLEEIS